tara:strand:+ start:469 stop:1050 length:582 start_codon:yes stop_codon:yes gene_type:complete
MESVYGFVIEPVGERYNNTVSVGEKKLILNTEIFNHEFVNRKARIISTPLVGETNLQVGDEVIVHHNVFRRWHDMKGKERNSKNYFDEKTYIVYHDQIFLYKRKNKWKCPKGFCFVQPLKNNDMLSQEEERPLIGVVKYTDGTVEVEDLVGFTPNSEYEFVFEGKRLYRVYSKFITIKYEYQGEEEEYNPSWV